MSRKAIVFSDVHNHNYPHFNKDGSRLKNCIKLIELCFKYANKQGADTILFCGDLYDSIGAIPTSVINETLACFKRMFTKYECIDFVAISGNHDHASKNLLHAPAVTALTHLDLAFPRFFLLDEKFAVHGLDECAVWGIPYFEHAEDFYVRLQETSEYAKQCGNKVNQLMMHQTPNALDNPNIPYDINFADPAFDTFDMVWDGHIHRGQELASNFVVVGSPLHRDLGDEGDEKSIILVENMYKPKEYERVSTRGMFPEFRRAKAGEPAETEEGVDNYIIEEPDMSSVILVEQAKVKEFNTSLTSAKLLENYWKEVDGKDQKLLQTGLGLLA